MCVVNRCVRATPTPTPQCIDDGTRCGAPGSYGACELCCSGRTYQIGSFTYCGIRPTAVPTSRPTTRPTPTPTCGGINQTCCPPNPPESYDNHCNNAYLKCGNGNKCVSTSTPICGENGQTCCPPNPPESYDNHCNNPYLTCGSGNKCVNISIVPSPTIPYVPNPTAIPSTGPLPTLPVSLTPMPTSPGSPPPPGPTNPPNPPANCSYDSLQARVQPDITVDWNTQLTVSSGEKVNLGCMHDGSGELAENVILVAEHSSGSKNEFNQNLVSQWEPPKTGNYTVWCKSTDGQCAGLVSSTNATLSAGSVCKECPNDFHCYGPADDQTDLGYAWFATGYVMQGWVTQVPDDYCTDYGGLVKPQWLGKGMGDANCDGKLDIGDVAIWRREFADISRGDKVYRQDWEADFTGTDGKCDGYVDLGDYSLWRAKFSLYSGGGS